MTRITIREHIGGIDGTNATIAFNHSEEYPLTISDPFSEEEERQLEWYFEEYPRSPFMKHVEAQAVAESITHYGEVLFAQIFNGSQVYARYSEAKQAGVNTIVFEIAGSPDFHRLHWEALKDPDLPNHFAIETPIVRKNMKPQVAYTGMRPSPTINVLLIVARPLGKYGVGYRTISRPLIEGLRKAKLPVQVDILRPGSYEALVEHLEWVSDHHGDGYYHIMHFDLHGALLTYDKLLAGYDANYYQSSYGRDNVDHYDGYRAYLFLEGEQDGQADPFSAEELSDLLSLHQIPIAILNATQSGKQVGGRETALGCRMMQSGIQTVIAVDYSMSFSGAERLFQMLYDRFLTERDLTTAMCYTRQTLHMHKERRAMYNQIVELEDWLLPVVYQNQILSPEGFHGQIQQLKVREFTPDEQDMFYEQQATTYPFPQSHSGFVGREIDILQIEKRLADYTLLLIRGIGGAGKTMLLHHLAAWWQATGFVEQVFYFSFAEDVWTSQKIIHAVAQDVFTKTGYYQDVFQTLNEHAQFSMLTRRLRTHPYLLILDNLESVHGTHLSVQNTLPMEEKAALRHFLATLIGGKTLVLLGSRGEEEWLMEEQGAIGALWARYSSPTPPLRKDDIYELHGLDPEAATILADRILEQYDIVPDYDDETFRYNLQTLIRLSGGYPLAMEVVLSNLAYQTLSDVLTQLGQQPTIISNRSLETRKLGAVETRRLEAVETRRLETIETLRLEAIETQRLQTEEENEDTKIILYCVAYSHSTMDPDIQDLLLCLTPFAPLVNHHVLERYTTYLQTQPILSYLPFSRWPKIMGEISHCQLLSSDPTHPDYMHLSPTFLYILRSRLRHTCQHMPDEASPTSGAEMATPNSTAPCHPNAVKQAIEIAFCHLYDAIANDITVLLESREAHARRQGQEMAQLEYDNLHNALLLALDARVSFIKPYKALSAYLELSQEYRRGLELGEYVVGRLEVYAEEEIKGQLATEYIEVLNTIAMRQLALKEYAKSESSYKKALSQHQDLLVYEEKKVILSATFYFNLGTIAQEQHKWAQAEAYYQQALQIYVEFEDPHGQANTYYQLGLITQEQRQWQHAQAQYQKALKLFTDIQEHQKQASVQYQMGVVVQEQQQWEQAQAFYQHALQTFEAFGDRLSQARTYYQLGMVAQEQRRWSGAEAYYRQALKLFVAFDERHEQAKTYAQMGMVAQAQRQWSQAKDCYQQVLQIYTKLDDSHNQAKTYHHLGMVAQAQRLWTQAESYYQQALKLFLTLGEGCEQAHMFTQLGLLFRVQHQWVQAEHYYNKALELYVQMQERHEQANTYHNLAIVSQAQHTWAKAEDYAQKALNLYRELKDHDRQANLYGQLGILARSQYQWERARDYFVHALEMYVADDDTYSAGIVLGDLAWVWKESGDESVPTTIASVLGMSPERVKERLRGNAK